MGGDLTGPGNLVTETMPITVLNFTGKNSRRHEQFGTMDIPFMVPERASWSTTVEFYLERIAPRRRPDTIVWLPVGYNDRRDTADFKKMLGELCAMLGIKVVCWGRLGPHMACGSSQQRFLFYRSSKRKVAVQMYSVSDTGEKVLVEPRLQLQGEFHTQLPVYILPPGEYEYLAGGKRPYRFRINEAAEKKDIK